MKEYVKATLFVFGGLSILGLAMLSWPLAKGVLIGMIPILGTILLIRLVAGTMKACSSR